MKLKIAKKLSFMIPAIALCSVLFLSCENELITDTAAESSIDSVLTDRSMKISSAAEKTAVVLEESESVEVYDLTLQIGSDETEMNFCWYSIDTTDAVVQIIPVSEMRRKPSRKSRVFVFTGTTAEVPEVEESTGGPGGTPPGMAAAVESTEEATETEDSDETEEETVTYISNEVCASGLKPNTEYMYRVGDGTDFSEFYSFTTGQNNQFSFMLVGDPQMGASRDVDSDQEGWEATVAAAIGNFPGTDFILGAGDQIEARSGNEDQYTAFFAPEEMTSIPFIACIGNHDTHELYQYHFNIPNESEEYGITEDVGGDYWFTYGHALFMVLNTNNSSGTTHEAFIEETVAEAGSSVKWKFVVFHQSIYSSASHTAARETGIMELRTALVPVLDAYDIDVVMMGHDHCYTRSFQMLDDEAQTEAGTSYVVNPEGTLYITANSASGSKYYDYTGSDSLYSDCTWQGYEASYSIVDVTNDSFRITTYTTEDGEVVDTYTIYKTDDRPERRHNQDRKKSSHR